MKLLEERPGSVKHNNINEFQISNIDKAVELQIEYWKNQSTNKTVFLLWVDRGVCSLTQQNIIKEELEKGPDILVICLFTGTPKEQFIDQYIELYGKNALYIPDMKSLHRLDFIDVIIGLDFWDCHSIAEFQKHIPRIGIPHGLDVTIDHMLHWYGAGIFYNFIFYHDLLKSDENEIKKFINFFPCSLIQHHKNVLKIVNTGNSKVEKLRKKYNSEARDILYCISDLDYESSLAISMLDDVITIIIREFPENNIVVRPFPGQVEKVKKVLKKASHLKSLTFSTSQCYIEDFSKTKVLIFNRGSSALVYSAATGNQSIRFDPENAYNKNPHSIHCSTISELIKLIRANLNNSESIDSAKDANSLHKPLNLAELVCSIVNKERIRICRELPIADDAFSIKNSLELETFLKKAINQNIFSPLLAASLKKLHIDSILLEYYYVYSGLLHLPMSSNFEEYDPWFDFIKSISEKKLLLQSEITCPVQRHLFKEVSKLVVFIFLGYLKHSSAFHSNEKKIEVIRLILNSFNNKDLINSLLLSRHHISQQKLKHTEYILFPLIYLFIISKDSILALLRKNLCFILSLRKNLSAIKHNPNLQIRTAQAVDSARSFLNYCSYFFSLRGRNTSLKNGFISLHTLDKKSNYRLLRKVFDCDKEFKHSSFFQNLLKGDFIFFLLLRIIKFAQNQKAEELLKLSKEIHRLPIDYNEIFSWNYQAQLYLLNRPPIR
jgi:hypothetical protein